MANINFDNNSFQSFDNNEYLDLCKKGQILVAVKKYKDATGCTLKEAKDYIDNLRIENGLKQPSDVSNSGCMVVFMAFIIILTVTLFIV